MSSLELQRLKLLEGLLEFTGRLATRTTRPSLRPEHLETGRRGEEAAYLFLRRQGYVIVARGWKSAKLQGDLDLIGWDDTTLCFVEVKTRTSREVAAAESAVDEEKCRILRRMARQYLRGLHAVPAQVRFDIVSIYMLPDRAIEFELFRGAFGWH
jgi:putative endonuclease